MRGAGRAFKGTRERLSWGGAAATAAGGQSAVNINESNKSREKTEALVRNAESQGKVVDPKALEAVRPRLTPIIPGGTVRQETTTEGSVGGSSRGIGAIFSWAKSCCTTKPSGVDD